MYQNTFWCGLVLNGLKYCVYFFTQLTFIIHTITLPKLIDPIIVCLERYTKESIFRTFLFIFHSALQLYRLWNTLYGCVCVCFYLVLTTQKCMHEYCSKYLVTSYAWWSWIGFYDEKKLNQSFFCANYRSTCTYMYMSTTCI